AVPPALRHRGRAAIVRADAEPVAVPLSLIQRAASSRTPARAAERPARRAHLRPPVHADLRWERPSGRDRPSGRIGSRGQAAAPTQRRLRLLPRSPADLPDVIRLSVFLLKKVF